MTTRKQARFSQGKSSTTSARVKSTDKPASQSPMPTAKGKGLHPRNTHNTSYDFSQLIAAEPQLAPMVNLNAYGNSSINFSDPEAVKMLNRALLKHHYQIQGWDIPQGFLCPPIPGRVDYIHYIADLLAVKGKIPKGQKVRALDIGTGANAIYPLLGMQLYGWQFVATDIDKVSLANVDSIIAANPKFKPKFESRRQTDAKQIFQGVINVNERFDITLCNPPFHSSLAEATEGTARKLKNLALNRAKKRTNEASQSVTEVSALKSAKHQLNFGGQKAELWCDGGEKRFLHTMILESKQFASQCLWFSSLVSKKDNVQPAINWLKDLGATEIKAIPMQQGQKQTRILAWTFLPEKNRLLWAKYRG